MLKFGKLSVNLSQRMIFKAIGYKPGQCNIGPYERSQSPLATLRGEKGHVE